MASRALVPAANISLLDPKDAHARWLAANLGGARVVCNLAEFAGSDIVFVATPLLVIPPTVRQLAALLREAVIIDCGSAKSAIIEAIAEGGPPIPNFVPGHPLGGGISSGPFGASAQIIQEKPFVLCPLDQTAPRSLQRAEEILAALGALPRRLSPAAHDYQLAYASHLPHLLAYALTAAALERGASGLDGTMIPGSLRAISRYTLGAGDMWAEIFKANEGELVRALDTFRDHLGELRGLVEAGDRDRLATRLGEVGAARRAAMGEVS